MKSKSKLIKVFVLGTLIALTSSCESWNEDRRNSMIYQPDSLRLKKGSIVQTVDGVYQAQEDELWISEKMYKEMVDYNQELIEKLK